MNYKDYNIEDMTFTNREDWTEAEKKEVLETFPETKDKEETLALCNQIISDIENGTIKTNNYEDINRTSAKAYAKKHEGCFYGITERYYIHAKEYLYIFVDGEKKSISRMYDVERIKAYLNDTEQRFENIKDRYIRKEKDEQKQREKDNYREAHNERIDANLKASALLDAVKIEIPTGLKTQTYGTGYYPITRKFDNLGTWSNELHHNDYYELTKNGVVISEQTANELTAMVQELSKEISDIIDIYNGKYKDILRKNA